MGACKVAAARPSGILALLLYDRNVTASGSNIFAMLSMSSLTLFTNIQLGLFLRDLFSRLSSLTRVFTLLGKSHKYVEDLDKFYPILFSLLWRSSKVVTVCTSLLGLMPSVTEDALTIFTIAERISGWSTSIRSLPGSIQLNNLSDFSAVGS